MNDLILQWIGSLIDSVKKNYFGACKERCLIESTIDNQQYTAPTANPFLFFYIKQTLYTVEYSSGTGNKHAAIKSMHLNFPVVWKPNFIYSQYSSVPKVMTRYKDSSGQAKCCFVEMTSEYFYQDFIKAGVSRDKECWYGDPSETQSVDLCRYRTQNWSLNQIVHNFIRRYHICYFAQSV